MNQTIKIVGGFLLGVAVGGVSGYLVQKKQLQKKYATMATLEIEDVKEHYKLIRKDGYTSPEVDDEDSESDEGFGGRRSTFVEKDGYSKLVKDLGYAQNQETMIINNVFNQFGDDGEPVDGDPEVSDEDSSFDELEAMIANRTVDEPYIISVGEYESKDDYKAIQLTYFDGDDVLVDDNNKVVPDTERLIGTEPLTRFGAFSEDTNVVYVRNERLDLKFQIRRDDRSWTDHLLGTPSSKPMKMKKDVE